MSTSLANKFWDTLSDDDFDRHVRENPWGALCNENACARLSDTQFDYCLNKQYGTLRYEHVCNRMTDTQLNYYIKACPYEALDSIHALLRLSDIQFDDCLKRRLERGLLPANIDHKLNPYQKAYLHLVPITQINQNLPYWERLPA